MGLNLKNLVGKLTPQTRRGLEGAAGLCMSRSHYEVAAEHWLVKLAENPGGDIARIAEHYDLAPDAVLRGIERGLDDYKTGNSGRPALGPDVEELLQDGWLRASVDYEHSRLRSGVVLLAHPEIALRLRRRFPGSMEGAPTLLTTMDTELRSSLDRWFDARGMAGNQPTTQNHRTAQP